MTNLPANARRIGQCAGFHAAREPDREAAVHDGTRLDYRALDELTARWAKSLLSAGVARGDRVASLTPPSIEWLAIMLATTEIGAIWTGWHPRYRLPEFRHVTRLAEPSVLIAFRRIHGRDYAGELDTLKRESPSVRRLVLLDEPLDRPIDGGIMVSEFLAAGDAVADRDLDAARRAVGLDDTAVLIFTSGTTGRPKAAMIRHRALLTGAAVQNEHWPMDRPRLLHMMPVNHIAGVGMTGVFGLYAGGALVFQDRFDPGDLLRLLEAERIDHVLGSPVQFHMMASHPDLATTDLSRLKFITWGGAPMAADLVARLHALPGELRTSFGMTELGLYVTFSEPDADLETLSRTIGKPHAGFDIRVADAAGAIAGPGEQGEIQARGEWLLAGYFRDPAATADAFTADGWFRTGDIVKVWPDGNLEIVGRTKEMYISGGFNVYPREVEIAIEAHPDVGLVAVLGVPDGTFGEVGHAFVEPKPGKTLDAAALRDWCRERLANYKSPKRFEVRAELPRLPIGKIDWLDGLAENQPVVRIEALTRPLQTSAISLDELEELLGRADSGDPDAAQAARRFFEAWNQRRDARPAFAAFHDEVRQEADDDDWPHTLRDRLGLGHYGYEDGTPLAVALMRYSLAEVFSAKASRRLPVPCALPTVLDGGMHEFFFPAPRENPYGATLHLSPGKADTLTAEIVHCRIDYKREHLWRLGRITRPHPMRGDDKLRRARDLHLLALQVECDREDFGEPFGGRT